MKPTADSCAQVETLLLDYAYGELDDVGRRHLEAHLGSCPGCRGALAQIGDTRRLMAALPAEPAPEAGLESLLAYAEQSARHLAADKPKAPAFLRWLVPALGFASVSAAALLLVTTRNADPARALAPPSAVVATPAPAPAPAATPTTAAPPPPSTPEPAKAVPAPDKVEAKPEPEGAKALADPAMAEPKVARREPEAQAPAKSEAAAPELSKRKDSKAQVDDDFDGVFGGASDLAQAGRDRREQRAAKTNELGDVGGGEGKIGGGASIGSHSFARAPAQTPVTGALPADESAADRSKTAGLMSNYLPLAGAEAQAEGRAAAPKEPEAENDKRDAPAREVVDAKKEAKPAAPKPSASPAPTMPAPVPAPAVAAARPAPAPVAKAPALKDAEEKQANRVSAATPEALLALGAEQATAGDLAGAEATYARFLATYPNHGKAAEVALWRVELLERLGRTGDAAVARAEYARRWPSAPGSGGGASGPKAAPAAPAKMRAAPAERALDAVQEPTPAAR